MSDFIKFAFAAGVISPALLGRSDLEKFDLGVAEAYNWFVDYRGGVSTRAGTKFLEYLKNDSYQVRITKFKFNAEIANTYLIIFGRDYIRFTQDGSYVLETAISVDGIVGGASAVVTAVGHGYSNGAWVVVSDDTVPTQYTAAVFNASANSFEIARIDGFPIADAPAGTTTAAVYEIPSPYDDEDLFDLSFEQSKNELIITSTKYESMRLVRNDTTEWELLPIVYGTNADGPTGLTAFPAESGSSGALFAVTAVNLEGEESVVREYLIVDNSANYTAKRGSLRLEWDAVPDTQYYNVYRSLYTNKGSEVTIGMDLGQLGSTSTTSFVDSNIIPDFTQTPPYNFNPFALGGVLHINITAAGSGYERDTTTISIADGTGFLGHVVVGKETTGEVQSVIIEHGGEGYAEDSVVTISGAGTGATAEIVATPSTGNNPRTSITNQQRRVYAGTDNAPMTLYGTRSGEKDSFDLGQAQTPAGPYFLEIDSDEQTPIKYMESASNGLFVFTEGDVWHARGQDDTALTADTASISPTTETGIGRVPPLKVEREVIYIEANSVSARALRPSNLPTYYVDADLSLFSSHFFSGDNQVISWAFAKDPHRLVWAVREDGSALAFTYVPEQNVYAWCDQYTAGQFLDVETVRESDIDKVYFIVERDGEKFLEELAPRRNTTVETMWAVDSGLSIGPVEYTDKLNVSQATGDVTLFGFDFTDYIGYHLRVHGGRILITAADAGTVELPLTNINKSTGLPGPSYSWTLGELFTTVTGLEHLEGRSVQILADGNELAPRFVSGGEIILDEPASIITAGLAFDATLVTLPLSTSDAIIEHKPKNVTAIAMRLADSRGVWAGAQDSGVMYEQKERTYEQYGFPIQLQNGISEISVRSGWTKSGSARIEKRGPFNITLLGLIVQADVGDA